MMFQLFLVALSLALLVKSESHTVRFQNNCGYGTPTLIKSGIVSTGQDYTSTGPFSSAIAYLQTGSCLFNGENCTLVEITLANPNCPGCGSSVDLSLISPHQFSVPTAFSYYGSCDGMGASCDTADCSTAFRDPNDNQVQVQCEENDVNVLITFCASSGSTPTSSEVINHVPSSNMTTTLPNPPRSRAVSTHSSAIPSLTAISSGVLLSSSLSSSIPASSLTPATPVSTPTSDNGGYDDDECDDGDEDGNESSSTSTILGTKVLLSPSSEGAMPLSLSTTSTTIPSSTIPSSTVTNNHVTVTETVTIYGCSESLQDPPQTSSVIVPTPAPPTTKSSSSPMPVSTTSGCEGEGCAGGSSSDDGLDCEDEDPGSSTPLSLTSSSKTVPRSTDATLSSLESTQHPSVLSDSSIPTATGTPVLAKHRRAFPWGGHRSRLEPNTY